MIYKNVTANVGFGYSTNTGKFTAPISGFYQILVSGSGVWRKTNGLVVRHNGKKIFRLDAKALDAEWYCHHPKARIHEVWKGEKLEVYADGKNELYDNEENFFIVQLIDVIEFC